MTKKILGAAIILGAIFGLIFLIKYIPVYVGNSELERSFSECLSNFKQYKDRGCRTYFAKIIEKNGLNVDAAAIRIDARVGKKDSVIEVEYTQHIDFFGVWTYDRTFHPRHTGRPPDRD